MKLAEKILIGVAIAGVAILLNIKQKEKDYADNHHERQWAEKNKHTLENYFFFKDPSMGTFVTCFDSSCESNFAIGAKGFDDVYSLTLSEAYIRKEYTKRGLDYNNTKGCFLSESIGLNFNILSLHEADSVEALVKDGYKSSPFFQKNLVTALKIRHDFFKKRLDGFKAYLKNELYAIKQYKVIVYQGTREINAIPKVLKAHVDFLKEQIKFHEKRMKKEKA